MSFNGLQSGNAFDSLSEFLVGEQHNEEAVSILAETQTVDKRKEEKPKVDEIEIENVKKPKPKPTKTVSFAEPPLPPTSGARAGKRLPQLHGQTKQAGQQRYRTGGASTQQGQQGNSMKFAKMLQPNKVQTSGHAIVPQTQLSDKMFIKVARIVSAKIPFVPLKVGINNDAEINTLYQKKTLDTVVDRKSVFKSDGSINLTGAMRSKKAAGTVSFFLLFVLMTFIRLDSFIMLMTWCFVASLITMYLRKERKEKRSQEKKEN